MRPQGWVFHTHVAPTEVFSSSSRGVRPRRTEKSTRRRRARARTSTGDHVDGDLKWARNRWTGVDWRPVAKRQAGLASCLSSFSLQERTLSPPVFPAPPLQDPGLFVGVFRQLETGCSRSVLPGPDTKKFVDGYLPVCCFPPGTCSGISVPSAHTAPRRFGHHPKKWFFRYPAKSQHSRRRRARVLPSIARSSNKRPMNLRRCCKRSTLVFLPTPRVSDECPQELVLFSRACSCCQT